MNDPSIALFVYHKLGKTKVLNLSDSMSSHDDMISDGWKHTATLDPSSFIEYLANSSQKEILTTIKGLKQ